MKDYISVALIISNMHFTIPHDSFVVDFGYDDDDNLVILAFVPRIVWYKNYNKPNDWPTFEIIELPVEDSEYFDIEERIVSLEQGMKIIRMCDEYCHIMTYKEVVRNKLNLQ